MGRLAVILAMVDWRHVHVGPRDKEGVIVARWGPYAWVAFDDVTYPVTYHFANLSPIVSATARDDQNTERKG